MVYVPRHMQPMTPEGWKVLGCAVLGICIALTALGLFFCIRNGFGDPDAVKVLLWGAGLTALVLVARYIALRIVG